MIRDRVVCGINEDAIQKRLLAEGDTLTLTKALSLAQAYETAVKDATIKTHDSESRGQEEAGRTRDEQVSYLHVAPL